MSTASLGLLFGALYASGTDARWWRAASAVGMALVGIAWIAFHLAARRHDSEATLSAVIGGGRYWQGYLGIALLAGGVSFFAGVQTMMGQAAGVMSVGLIGIALMRYLTRPSPGAASRIR